MKKNSFLFVFLLITIPLSAQALSVSASKSIFIIQSGNPNYEEQLSVYFDLAFNPPTVANQSTAISGSLMRGGQGGASPYSLVGEQVCVGCANSVTLSQSMFTKSNPTTVSVAYPVSTTFTVPSPGNYTLQIAASESPEFVGNIHHIDQYAGSVSFTVPPTTPLCSDGLNNDNAQGADTLDPECHTDCNAANANSFAPNHTSETTPPNGSCPAAATLELNGRAAFLEVVKTFFAAITTKAFAGQ